VRWAKLSRRSVGSVVAILFIIAAILIAFVVINRFMGVQSKISEIQEEKVKLLKESLAISKSISSTWYYDEALEELTINITNNYVEPIRVFAITILYTDNSYDILNSTLSGNPKVISSTASSLPLWLRPGETLEVKIDTNGKTPTSVRIALSSIGSIVGVSSKKQVPYYMPNVTIPISYKIKLTPISMGEGTITTKGYDLEDNSIIPSNIVVHRGIDDPSNDISYIYTPNDGLLYKVGSEVSVRSDWLSGWLYRKPIHITNTLTSPLNEYQVKVELNNTNFDFAKANPDGSDIRFTLDDGVTLIPYWVEKWDSVNQEAIVWVKVPELPANSNVTIYMYYGNPETSFDPNYHGLAKVMEPLPASDGNGYIIYYEEWIMPENRFQEIGDVLYRNYRDDWGDWYALPFEFPYYGSTYLQIWICSNGFIGTTYDETDYSSTESEFKDRGMIAPFWADLRDTDRNGTNYAIFHVPDYSDEYGTGVYIRWRAQFYPAQGLVNVAVVLYSNGLIRFDYGTIYGSSWTDDTPVIGISLGDNIHYTLSSYNGLQYPSNYNSVMFWPRKKADTEPTYSFGSEETYYAYLSEVEVDFDNVLLNSVKFDFNVRIGFNVSNVKVRFCFWNGSGWEGVYEDIVPNANEFKDITFSVYASRYLNDGYVKLSINVTCNEPFEEYIDYVSLTAYTPTRTIIYVGVGGTNNIYKYILDSDTFEGPITAEFAGSPITFYGNVSMNFDYDRYLLWVVNGSKVYYYNITDGQWYLYSTLAEPVGYGCSINYVNGKLYIIIGGGSDKMYILDLASWGSPPTYTSLGFNVYEYSVTESDGRFLYIVQGGGYVGFYKFDTTSNNVEPLNDAPTGYPVGLTYDGDRGVLWLIGKGGGLFYYDISNDAWKPYKIQVPYTPQEQGDRLEYYNSKLYHFRDDETRELWIINIS